MKSDKSRIYIVIEKNNKDDVHIKIATPNFRKAYHEIISLLPVYKYEKEYLFDRLEIWEHGEKINSYNSIFNCGDIRQQISLYDKKQLKSANADFLTNLKNEIFKDKIGVM